MWFSRPSLGVAVALLVAIVAQPASAQRRRFVPPSHPPRAAGAPSANHNSTPAPQHPATGTEAEHPSNTAPSSSVATAGGAAGNGTAQGVADVQNRPNFNRIPPAWEQRLRSMSPQEQERFLQNNQRFQNLPPQQQQRIRQRLQQWNRLSPTEQGALKDRAEIWSRMTPEQQQHVKTDLLPKWQQMPTERRALINGRLHTLQGMTPEQRQAALNDPKFMQGLNPDEQGVLRDLNSLRNP